MLVGAIDWVMSLDPTWYLLIYGLMFLVAQGYAVLALAIITVLRLSKAEPMKTVLRTTEQHDLGKLAFAFVMLNIYLAFSHVLLSGQETCRRRFPGISTVFAAAGG